MPPEGPCAALSAAKTLICMESLAAKLSQRNHLFDPSSEPWMRGTTLKGQIYDSALLAPYALAHYPYQLEQPAAWIALCPTRRVF